jgi:hypothetical protein
MVFLPVDNVNDGLGEGDLLDGGHVEPVHVLPPVDLVVLQQAFQSILSSLRLWHDQVRFPLPTRCPPSALMEIIIKKDMFRILSVPYFILPPHRLHCVGRVLGSNPEVKSKKKKKWRMGPYAGADYNLTLCPLQSRLQSPNTFTMDNPMPESTLTLCQRRL